MNFKYIIKFQSRLLDEILIDLSKFLDFFIRAPNLRALSSYNPLPLQRALPSSTSKAVYKIHDLNKVTRVTWVMTPT